MISYAPSRNALGAAAALLFTLIATLHFFLTPSVVLADATPVRVVLTYLSGTSNWGPQDASGLMEFVRQEGEIRVTASDLPAIPGKHYVLWITRQGTSQFFRLGDPTRNTNGTTILDLVVPQNIPNRGWNLAMITVEDTASPSQPSKQISIAGRFPLSTPRGVIPKTLPNTGLGGMAAVEAAEACSNTSVVGSTGVVDSAGPGSSCSGQSQTVWSLIVGTLIAAAIGFSLYFTAQRRSE